MHERRHGRDDPPGDHDPADPLACTPALDQEGAGNLQEQVSDEENAHPEAEDAFGEPQGRQSPCMFSLAKPTFTRST